jgi:hypothetical protein
MSRIEERAANGFGLTDVLAGAFCQLKLSALVQ